MTVASTSSSPIHTTIWDCLESTSLDQRALLRDNVGHVSIPPRENRPTSTLREGDNTRSEFLIFEVADFDLAYNCILGRPFLKKFMAVTHFAYSVLKVPSAHGPMTIHGDRKGAMACDMKTLDMIKQYT